MADWIKYAQAKTHNFTLYLADGTKLAPGITFVLGDIMIATNGGGDIAIPTIDLPIAYGDGYSMAFTAAQTTGKKVRLTFKDQAATQKWLDVTMYFDTYGHALAEHPFDLGTASVPQTADHAASITQIFNDTGDMRPKLGVPAAGSISADIATRSVFNATTDTVANVTIVQTIANNVNAMVQGYLATALTELTAGRIAGNFDTFFENADAATTKVVDNVGGGAAVDPWLTILPGAYTVGQAGKIIGDNIDATISAGNAATVDIQARIPAALLNGRMESNMAAINNNVISALHLELGSLGLDTGACVGTPTFTQIQTDFTFGADNVPVGRQLFIITGAGRGIGTDITGWVQATNTLTVTAIPLAPVAGDLLVIS